MAYSKYRQITLGKATNSDQSGFPVLIKFDSSNVGTTFKTVSNGGHIQNTVTQSGGNPITMPADLIFTSDAGGATKIPWEVDSYDGTNGILWAWVYLSTLHTATNDIIYVFYDDATVTTQQNVGSFAVSNVWSSYASVWHVPDGTTLYGNDSTSNGINISFFGSGIAAPAMIDGGYETYSNGYGEAANTSVLNFTTQNFSVSYWLYQSIFSNVIGTGQGSYMNLGWYTYHSGGTDIEFNSENGSQLSVITGPVLTQNVWQYITMVRTGPTTAAIYLNGVPQTVSGSLHSTFGSDTVDPVYFNGLNGGFAAKGYIDEVRIANIILTADRTATEYANQNAPLSFNTIGAETPAARNSAMLSFF